MFGLVTHDSSPGGQSGDQMDWMMSQIIGIKRRAQDQDGFDDRSTKRHRGFQTPMLNRNLPPLDRLRRVASVIPSVSDLVGFTSGTNPFEFVQRQDSEERSPIVVTFTDTINTSSMFAYPAWSMTKQDVLFHPDHGNIKTVFNEIKSVTVDKAGNHAILCVNKINALLKMHRERLQPAVDFGLSLSVIGRYLQEMFHFEGVGERLISDAGRNLHQVVVRGNATTHAYWDGVKVKDHVTNAMTDASKYAGIKVGFAFVFQTGDVTEHDPNWMLVPVADIDYHMHQDIAHGTAMGLDMAKAESRIWSPKFTELKGELKAELIRVIGDHNPQQLEQSGIDAKQAVDDAKVALRAFDDGAPEEKGPDPAARREELVQAVELAEAEATVVQTVRESYQDDRARVVDILNRETVGPDEIDKIVKYLEEMRLKYGSRSFAAHVHQVYPRVNRHVYDYVDPASVEAGQRVARRAENDRLLDRYMRNPVEFLRPRVMYSVIYIGRVATSQENQSSVRHRLISNKEITENEKREMFNHSPRHTIIVDPDASWEMHPHF